MKITGYSYSWISPNYFKFEVESSEGDTNNIYQLYESHANMIVLEKPPDGYFYKLEEDTRKKCAKCGNFSENYAIAPYGSKFDGEAICANCIDK